MWSFQSVLKFQDILYKNLMKEFFLLALCWVIFVKPLSQTTLKSQMNPATNSNISEQSQIYNLDRI